MVRDDYFCCCFFFLTFFVFLIHGGGFIYLSLLSHSALMKLWSILLQEVIKKRSRTELPSTN